MAFRSGEDFTVVIVGHAVVVAVGADGEVWTDTFYDIDNLFAVDLFQYIHQQGKLPVKGCEAVGAVCVAELSRPLILFTAPRRLRLLPLFQVLHSFFLSLRFSVILPVPVPQGRRIVY